MGRGGGEPGKESERDRRLIRNERARGRVVSEKEGGRDRDRDRDRDTEREREREILYTVYQHSRHLRRLTTLDGFGSMSSRSDVPLVRFVPALLCPGLLCPGLLCSGLMCPHPLC